MDKIEFQDFRFNSIETFQFLQVPRVLITNEYFKDLSIDAIMLYTLLLDTYKLSTKNNWRDESGNVYIKFTIKRIEDFLRCGNHKAIKTLKELDSENGIGLIKVKKQKNGLPNLIYVKDFNNEQLYNYDSHKKYIEDDINNLESSANLAQVTSAKNAPDQCEKCTRPVLKSHSSNNKNNNISNNEYNSSKQQIPYKEILDYLNEKANTSFRHTAYKNQSLIKARWNEGNSLDDFKKVIDIKAKEWLQDETMKKYLRPSTLFGNKFDEYRNQYIRTSINKERSIGDNYESFAEKARKARIEKQKKLERKWSLHKK